MPAGLFAANERAWNKILIHTQWQNLNLVLGLFKPFSIFTNYLRFNKKETLIIYSSLGFLQTEKVTYRI